MEADTELRKQHQRGAILRDRMRKAFDMADPDPMGDALHLSPGLALQPGDFVELVR